MFSFVGAIVALLVGPRVQTVSDCLDSAVNYVTQWLLRWDDHRILLPENRGVRSSHSAELCTLYGRPKMFNWTRKMENKA